MALGHDTVRRTTSLLIPHGIHLPPIISCSCPIAMREISTRHNSSATRPSAGLRYTPRDSRGCSIPPSLWCQFRQHPPAPFPHLLLVPGIPLEHLIPILVSIRCPDIVVVFQFEDMVARRVKINRAICHVGKPAAPRQQLPVIPDILILFETPVPLAGKRLPVGAHSRAGNRRRSGCAWCLSR